MSEDRAEHGRRTLHIRAIQGIFIIGLVSLITLPYIAVIHGSGMTNSAVYALASIFTLGAVSVLNWASKRVLDRPAVELG